MPPRLGIIGYPLGHSLSPVMFRAALAHRGLNFTYDPWEIPPDGLDDFLDRARDPTAGVAGFNATVPHKESVMGAMDRLSAEARRAAAVNTVSVVDGELHGHNTDGLGFVRALKEEAGFNLAGCRALIIGAGGAARGVVMAMATEGAAEFTIANRTPQRARRLAGDLSAHWRGPARVVEMWPAELRMAAAGANLIVQCTTMGMLHSPAAGESPLSSQDIPSEATVYDLVYNPPETPLLREARRAGAAAYGGLSMLVHQGAVGFESWTGRPAPVQVMFRAAQEALARRGNQQLETA